MEVLKESSATASIADSKSKKQRYRKDKPWDTDDIDHWAPVTITSDDVDQPLVEESSFATLFPKYREKYLLEVWGQVQSALKSHGIKAKLDVVEGCMTVTTTRKVIDPYIILKARDVIKLLSRSVPFHQAIRVLQDDINCDVIKIGGLVRNKERFVKRRQRLIGPNGATLKAIEILTDCYVLVQGKTVSCMGSYKGLKVVRRVVEDCMRNIHPIYNIKQLMIKRELAKNPALANENWDRFLPKFKKKNIKRKKRPVVTKPGETGGELPSTLTSACDSAYSPFPPPQTPRKVDLQIESGEYFMSDADRAARKLAEREKKQAAKNAESKVARDTLPVAPPEPERARAKSSTTPTSTSEIDAAALAARVSAASNARAVGRSRDVIDAQSFIATAKSSKKRKNDDDDAGDAVDGEKKKSRRK